MEERKKAIARIARWLEKTYPIRRGAELYPLDTDRIAVGLLLPVARMLSKHDISYRPVRDGLSFGFSAEYPIPEGLKLQRGRTTSLASHVYAYLSEAKKQCDQDFTPAVFRFCTRCGQFCNIHYDGNEDCEIKHCERCFQEEYSKCPMCEQWTHSRDGRRVVSGQGTTSVWCHDCFGKAKHQRLLTRCPQCGCHAVHLKKGMCMSCYNHQYKTCNSCFKKYRQRQRNRADRGYCEPCLVRIYPFQSYQFKPSEYIFKLTSIEKRSKETMFLGFEFEFELGELDRGKVAAELKQQWGYEDFYIVHDGSLLNGLEMVTMPRSVTYHKQNKEELVALYEDIARRGGKFQRKTVGFHIHTSKDAWSKTQVYKLVRFMYDALLGEHPDVYRKITGREPNKHSRFRRGEAMNAVRVARYKNNYNRMDHYNLLNLTLPQSIEFRSFCGPWNAKVMLRHIEYVLSFFEYTKVETMSGISLSSYINFINANKSEFPLVCKHLHLCLR